ncbi:Slam-dependent surface lipoprotein [Lysobacter sp. CA199]|uniref:Slam-dependent surface lipoprotein n=1 Tax=Lysobacter sp. CA199 TaxID=3455608 RepID=UPI003F8D87AF
MKRISLTLAVLTAAMIAGGANAAVVGDQSDNTYVEAGVSVVNAGPHVAGRPGIGVYTMGTSQKVDFQGLQLFAAPDANGVSNLSQPITPPSHSGMGVFHFAKIAGQNVYFGEWSKDAAGTDSHTVYYAGDNTGTTVPGSGTATYTVAGLSQYNGSNKLNGTLTANFGAGQLSGSLSNGSLTVDIGTAAISGTGFSGSGASASVGGSTVASGGVSGQFFGANAAALAGVTRFDDRLYDTAFGGTKNP